MSSADPALPITPTRFAAALEDLPLASLHLKTLELRNSLAHLAYSNAQLRPFADGTEPAAAGPDPDCADAIRENELVMARVRERILLVRAEVEGRGLSWREFEGGPYDDDNDQDEAGGVATEITAEEGASSGVAGGASGPLSNGVSGATAPGPSAAETSRTAGNPWTDGTFQVGVIRNGEIHMDAPPAPESRGPGVASGPGAGATSAAASSDARAGGAAGGRLTDEELRRALEERLAEDGADDEDGGLHL